MKSRAPVLLGLLLVAPTWAGLDFAFDVTAFRSAHPDSVELELYHSVNYRQLHFQSFGDTLYAEYLLTLRLTNLETRDSVVQSLYEPATIPSYAEAARRQLTVVHSFAVAVVPVRYELQLTLRDTLNQGTRTETLVVRDLARRPSISDPLIGSSVVRAESGPASVMPRVDRTFSRAQPTQMYVFIDGYDFSSPAQAPTETLAHDLLVTILDSSGAIVKSLPPDRRYRRASGFSEIFGLTTQGLKSGPYRLRVKVQDALTGRADSAEKPFRVAEMSSAPVTRPALDTSQLSADERRYYSDLRYIATEQEQRTLKRLSAEGQAAYLARFWQQHDFPTYLARLRLADARYGWGRVPGRETDQGRIFIRHGEPDEIEVHTMIEHTRPHEHWHYYARGYQYIFVDVRSNGRLRLVYTNDPDEHNDPNWEKLVDPLELDELLQR
ncbi:MAG: GWxTD domain-containing protein [candidate division WOR-3 bacterium]